jgi:hypothetical protein
MSNTSIKSTGLLVAGFAAGLLVSRLPHAVAASDSVDTDLSKKEFIVSIDEIRQNFVFGDPFVGHYYKTVTMSDGKTRRIELTPMIHNGMQVVEFKDNRGVSYMGLNGTTTNDTLMVQLRDVDTMQGEAKTEGWPFPASSGGAYPIPILPILPVSVVFQRIPGAQSETMTVTNEIEQPINLFVAIFNSGKLVGTEQISVPARASSTVDASQLWKNPRQSSNPPGQGPQPGDQVRLIDIPNQAGSHAAKYQEWRGTVP